MQTYTVSMGPEMIPVITPGLVISEYNGGFAVLLGGPGRLASKAAIPLYAGNVPYITVDKEKDVAFTLNAYPMELTLRSGIGEYTEMMLAHPSKWTLGLVMVRFMFGASVSPENRACVWPTEGCPGLIGYTAIGSSYDIWPKWDNDSLWTMGGPDAFDITLHSGDVYRCKFDQVLTIRKLGEMS